MKSYEQNFLEIAKKYGGENFTEKAYLEIASQKDFLDTVDEVASVIFKKIESVEQKTRVAEEIARVIVEKVSDEWKGLNIKDIFEVRNLKLGESKRISLDKKFRATYLNKGANSVEQTLDITEMEIPTSVIDVMVDVPIFKFLSGVATAKDIESKMKEALDQRLLAMAMEVAIASTETTNTNLYTSLASSTNVPDDLKAALNKAWRNVKNPSGIIGARGNIGYVYELPGYSEKYMEKVDSGNLSTFKGLPMIAIDNDSDKNGDSTIIDKSSNNILDTILVPRKGRNFIAIVGASFSASQYDVKQKKYIFNMFIEAGAASINNENGRILMPA